MVLPLLFLLCVAPPSRSIYISPSGQDSAPGDSPDHALATLTAARDHARAMHNANKSAPQPIRIVLAPGLYTLDQTFTLTPQDSGDPSAPITYAAATPGAVVISGGTKLPAWKPAELHGRPVWAATLPDSITLPADGSTAFRSLWINYQRRTWARYPNAGAFAHVEAIPERPPGDWTKGPSSFTFSPADAEAWIKSGPGVHVTTFTRWIDSHLRTTVIDPEKRLARFATPNMISLDLGDLYFLEGAEALLDRPGEWWCDPATRTVYTIPEPGDKPDAESFVPRLSELVRIQGDPAQSQFVHDIRFEGLTFAHARWWFPPSPANQPEPAAVGFMQAAVGVPGAIECEGVHQITFDHCTIRATEAYAIEFGRACAENTLQSCTITDLGAGGVKIGETAIRPNASETTTHNTVQDCTITDGGHIHHQAIGVWIGQSPANTLSHNLIAEFDYTGISIGWTWGYGPANAGGNIVEWNEIRSLGARPGNDEPPLGDMGGIYTLGAQPGAIIRNNYFHDIAGHTIAWGIYFDEGSTGILAENNIVYRTTHGSFHQHYGKDNILRNNLFMQGRDAQLWRTRLEDHNSFTFEHNIVVGASKSWLNGDWTKNFVTASNLYFKPGSQPITFSGNQSLEQWQAAGHDKDSVIADPDLILDHPEHPTFGPRAASAAKAFSLPDLTGVGPRR